MLRIEPDGTEEGFREKLALPLWKSVHSLNLMLPKEDRSAMLLRLYNDTTPLVNNGLKMQRDREEQKKKEAEEAAAEEQQGVTDAEAPEVAEAMEGVDATAADEDVGGVPVGNGEEAQA